MSEERSRSIADLLVRAMAHINNSSKLTLAVMKGPPENLGKVMMFIACDQVRTPKQSKKAPQTPRRITAESQSQETPAR